MLLDAFGKVLVWCGECDLGRDRSVRSVRASGPPSSRVLFLGEAPGINEDEQGAPFVGRSGDVLMTLLSRMRLTRNQVAITNTCLCRPPDNRTPTEVEVETCTRRYFWLTLRRFQGVRLLVPLGRTATDFLLRRSGGILSTAGTFYNWCCGAFLVYPMVHPAYTFRSAVALSRWEEDGARLVRMWLTNRMAIRRADDAKVPGRVPQCGTRGLSSGEPRIQAKGLR